MTTQSSIIRSQKERWGSVDEFEVESDVVTERWEDNIIWNVEDILPVDINNFKPKPWTLDYNDRDASLRRYLHYHLEEVENILRREESSAPTGSDRPKYKTQPHRDKTKKLLGRTGILKTSSEEIQEQEENWANIRKDPKAKVLGLDPFNISNDKYYQPPFEALQKIPLPHSTPVLELRTPLIPTHLGPYQLRKLHRPSTNLFLKGSGPHSIRALTKFIARKAKAREAELLANGVISMRYVEDLSGRDGAMVLVEYCEEFPPLMSQIGMCSKILNYIKLSSERKEIPQMAIGENVIMHTSPFLGSMQPGQILQAIENNLYRAPIYPHEHSDTDFILIGSSGGFCIREYDHLFTAGQECPFMEVPSPTSRQAAKFITDLLQIYIFRLFLRCRETPKRLQYQDIRKAFPTYPESSIRKRLKECADFKRSGGDSNFWFLKDDFRLPKEDEIRQMITPEQCCAYLSCIAGEQRLRDAGFGAESIFSPEEENEESSTRKIEDEVSFASWNTTKAFIQAQRGRILLDVAGQADPTGIGEGFSYVKLLPNAVTKNESPPQEKRHVCGTDADLRKLGLKESKRVLRKLGLPENEIQKLNRWEIIDVIRTMSTEKAKSGKRDGVHKFSRGKFSSKSMTEIRYKEECQRIFEVQNLVLSADTPLTSDDEDDSSDEEEAAGEDEELEAMARGVEEMLMEDKTVEEFAFEKEEKERKELKKMIMNNEIIPGDKAQAKSKSDENDKINNLISDHKHGRTLRIQRIYQNPNGTQYTRSEIVRSPSVIDIYVRMRATRNETFIRRFAFADEHENLRKEKRRLQDQIRCMKREQNLLPPSKQRPSKPKPPKPKKVKENVPTPKITCSACQQVGHMKTNKNCPKYDEQFDIASKAEEQFDKECEMKLNASSNVVRLDGTKLHVSGKFVVNNSGIKRPPITMKVKREDWNKHKPQTQNNGKKRKHPDDDYEYYARVPKSQRFNRMRLDPNVLISNIFEEVVKAMQGDPASDDFIFPANRRKLPKYYEIVQTPMCLQFMRDKIRHFTYRSRAEFLNDVKLLVDNSTKYNGENHLSTVCAQKLYSIADNMIEQRLLDIEKYEMMIKDDDPHLNEGTKV